MLASMYLRMKFWEKGIIARMHDKDIFVVMRIERLLPRNGNAKAQRKCLRHLKESPSSCKVPSSYLKVSKFQETHFQHKPLFLCIFSPSWSSTFLPSFDSPTESWFGAPVLHLPLLLLPLDPSKSALAPLPNPFLAPSQPYTTPPHPLRCKWRLLWQQDLLRIFFLNYPQRFSVFKLHISYLFKNEHFECVVISAGKDAKEPNKNSITGAGPHLDKNIINYYTSHRAPPFEDNDS